MKAAKNTGAVIFKTAAVLLLIGFQSCGTYNSKTSEIESDLLNGNFDNAIANIDKNKFLQKDRNRLLYLLEKGKMEHLKGNYEVSNQLFEDAYILIDDQIKTNAGQAVAAKFTNPMAEPYKGEDFEKVTIHYYKALNYSHLGMPNEALVEAKRINIKLLELNDRYPDNKNKYKEDAFSQIIQGILYEGTGDINGAFIAYRNAQEIYDRNGGTYFNVPLPEQLKEDLLRTSRQLGFTQEHNDYLKKFRPQDFSDGGKPSAKNPKKEMGMPPMPKPTPTGEAVVFWENGLGPAKDQIILTVSGTGYFFYATYMDGDVMEDILIPIPSGINIGTVNAIAIPKYRKRENYYSKASIFVNGNEQKFELAQDFYPIAKECLKDRMLRETIDLVLRFATKKGASALLGALADGTTKDNKDGSNNLGDLVRLGADIAGAATEKADTRNWQSLPATISYARVPLQEGVDNKFIIKKYGPKGIDTDTITIPYRRGLQIVNYFDLGRTQILPANNNAATTSKFVPNVNLEPATKDGLASNSAAIPAEAPGMAQNIVAKYTKALGGAEKLKAVSTTLTISSVKTTVQDGAIIIKEVTSKTAANNNNYQKTVTNGKTVETVTLKGYEGFVKDGSKYVKMSPEQYNTSLMLSKPLQNYNLPLEGESLKYEGIAIVNNQRTYALSFIEPVTKSGIINYYSVATSLLIATKTSTPVGKELAVTTSYFTDYKDVNGLKFPYTITTKGDNITSEERITQLKINDGVTEADFKIN